MSNDVNKNEPGISPERPIPPVTPKTRKTKGGNGEYPAPIEAEAVKPSTSDAAAAAPIGGEGAKSAEPDSTKKPGLKLVPSGAPEDIFNDIESLRKVAELKVQRRSVSINMEVRKPPDNGYFQCHPDPAQRIDASLVYDKEEGDVFFVHPHMMNHPLLLPRLRRVTIVTTYTWPAGNVFLWPVPFPDERGRVKCWKSARHAFEISCGLAPDLDPPGPRWVQMSWNAEARDYDVGTAEGINNSPIWPPGLSLGNSLKLGFADKTIASEEHYYVRQLRGLA
jgi:hypothetical protein